MEFACYAICNDASNRICTFRLSTRFVHKFYFCDLWADLSSIFRHTEYVHVGL